MEAADAVASIKEATVADTREAMVVEAMVSSKVRSLHVPKEETHMVQAGSIRPRTGVRVEEVVSRVRVLLSALNVTDIVQDRATSLQLQMVDFSHSKDREALERSGEPPIVFQSFNGEGFSGVWVDSTSSNASN